MSSFNRQRGHGNYDFLLWTVGLIAFGIVAALALAGWASWKWWIK